MIITATSNSSSEIFLQILKSHWQFVIVNVCNIISRWGHLCRNHVQSAAGSQQCLISMSLNKLIAKLIWLPSTKTWNETSRKIDNFRICTSAFVQICKIDGQNELRRIDEQAWSQAHRRLCSRSSTPVAKVFGRQVKMWHWYKPPAERP